jgi:putative ABC transport system permease protein
MLVLVSAGLLGKGMMRMYGDTLGFDPHSLTTAGVFTSNYRLGRPRTAFFDQVVATLETTPGVDSAGAATQVPFLDGGDAFRYRLAEAPSSAPTRFALFCAATPGYFRAIRLPLLRGRTFSDADSADAPLAAVVNEALASREWPGQDPLGRQVALGPDFKRVFTVVGVVADTHGEQFSGNVPPEIYVYHHQFSSPVMTLVARSATEGGDIASDIRRAVNAADPTQAVNLVMTMDQAMMTRRAPYAIVSQITACFAAVALLLGAIGIYGVTAYAANARRREFGIRMALGAGRGSIIGLVARRGAALAAIGLASGAAAAFGATRFLTSMLYHVRPTDSATFAWTSVFLAAVTLIACYLPARRAADADPALILRDE